MNLAKHLRAASAAVRSPIDATRTSIAALRAGSVATVVGVIVAQNGATEPTMGTRTFEIENILDIGDDGIAVGLATLAVGMLVTSMVAGWLVDHLGTRRVLTAGAASCWLAFATIGFTFTLGEVALPLVGTRVPLGLVIPQFLVGVGFALLDVPLYRVSAWYEIEQRKAGGSGRLENQATHAFYSVGSLSGAGIGYLAVWLGVPISWHLAAFGLAVLAATLLYAVPRVPDLRGEPITVPQARRRLRRSLPLPRHNVGELRLAAVVGGAAAFAVIVGFNWSGILLDRLGASNTVATLGVIAYTAASAVSRTVIHRRSKDGVKHPVSVVRFSAIGAIGGIALIAVPGRIDAAILGFAVLGASLAPIAPLVGSVAGHLSGRAQGKGIALTQRYVYGGLLLAYGAGPLSEALGSSETAVSLRLALGGLVVFPLLIIALAGSTRSARGQTAL